MTAIACASTSGKMSAGGGIGTFVAELASLAAVKRVTALRFWSEPPDGPEVIKLGKEDFLARDASGSLEAGIVYSVMDEEKFRFGERRGLK